jgi:hypothetical protein
MRVGKLATRQLDCRFFDKTRHRRESITPIDNIAESGISTAPETGQSLQGHSMISSAPPHNGQNRDCHAGATQIG